MFIIIIDQGKTFAEALLDAMKNTVIRQLYKNERWRIIHFELIVPESYLRLLA